MAETAQGWELGPGDIIVLNLLTGWSSMIAGGKGCCLQVQYAATPAALEAREFAKLPLVMEPRLAREIAAALLRMADSVEALRNKNNPV